MKEIQVDYTLEEIKAYIKEQGYKSTSSHTCRMGDDDKLLTGNFILIDHCVNATDYTVSYTALTKDNFLITTQVFEPHYGTLVKHKYFGISSGCSIRTQNIFSMLPKKCQNELIAKEWLARNPDTLVDKLKAVLATPAIVMEEQDKVISKTEEMLVNAHHNMKKVPKATFTDAWSRWDVLKKLPWFSSCIEKELSNES